MDEKWQVIYFEILRILHNIEEYGLNSVIPHLRKSKLPSLDLEYTRLGLDFDIFYDIICLYESIHIRG